MSWWNPNWTRRWPVAVDKLTAGVAAVDVTFTMPAGLEEFWSVVKTNGEDVRIVTAAGILCTFDLNGFDKTNRAGTFEVQSVTPPAANSVFLLWLYWGNAAASSGVTPFVPSSPRAGYVEPGLPADRIVRVAPEQPGAVRPRTLTPKGSAEQIHVWWDLGQIFATYPCPYNSSRFYETISYAQFRVLEAGADQASEHDDTAIRFYGNSFIRTLVKAGTDGEDRTLSLLVGTTTGRLLDCRAWLKIRDVEEQ